jgi:uncharacterized protein
MHNKKFEDLLDILKGLGSAVLAYSGGTDSSFLLKALSLSRIKTLAVTADSEITPEADIQMSREIADTLHMEHRLLQTNEIAIEAFVSNTPERCYICKEERFRNISRMASMEGYRFVLDGSNTTDTADYRPGRKAAVKYQIRSPLIEATFSKNEIRELSRELGLPTWDRPSTPCLATRIPYGRRITREALRRVARAEEFLRALGFRDIRVRDHGDTARIEVEEEKIDLMIVQRKVISETLKSLGYPFIALDLDGYRSGSMNRTLQDLWHE